MIEFFQNYALTGAMLFAVGLLVSQIIPVKSYQIMATMVCVLGLVVSVFLYGQKSEREKWDKIVVEMKEKEAKLESQRKDINIEVAILAAKNREKIIEKGTIKYVRQYITVQDDANCIISDGFIRLHNDSAEGTVSNTPQ